MVQLLAAIWDDRAGPPEACARVRHLMAQQLTRHRLASGFAAGVKVAAKSGGLAGMVRNEVGVITYPDGSRYAAAVFTRTRPGADAGQSMPRSAGARGSPSTSFAARRARGVYDRRVALDSARDSPGRARVKPPPFSASGHLTDRISRSADKTLAIVRSVGVPDGLARGGAVGVAGLQERPSQPCRSWRWPGGPLCQSPLTVGMPAAHLMSQSQGQSRCRNAC